ncbi:hypothetical protein B0T22DRAFT_539963 [Podospora appendiculata]|uniref:Uncharacterized protein n=1 Tax=Podospora appendiculata TaxID=314037 RepID=A0AAE0WZU2_9PEZI|nr:hypothetical protein B0T22DRAFT_539963 [Podospora appendiculata]
MSLEQPRFLLLQITAALAVIVARRPDYLPQAEAIDQIIGTTINHVAQVVQPLDRHHRCQAMSLVPQTFWAYTQALKRLLRRADAQLPAGPCAAQRFRERAALVRALFVTVEGMAGEVFGGPRGLLRAPGGGGGQRARAGLHARHALGRVAPVLAAGHAELLGRFLVRGGAGLG